MALAPACENTNEGVSRYVKFNVSGTLFHVEKRYLAACRPLVEVIDADVCDASGCVIVDRPAEPFEAMLAYLRDGPAFELPTCRLKLRALLAEARHFAVEGLINDCRIALDERNDDHERNVTTVMASREAAALVQASDRPVVKLLFNRHNNKYSYTPTSDDNLLKNLELFDRLSMRFARAMLFIKDVDEMSEEICRWSFYRNGRSMATVCCTSTVYDTDKMYTRVEYPEARIYEIADLIAHNTD